MRFQNHVFDLKKVHFSAKIVLICAVVGVAGDYGFLYAQSHLLPGDPSTQRNPLTPTASAASFSTTTPVRIINSLTIADAVPAQGKFIAADLVHMKLYLYQNGTTTATYPILTKGRPGTPYETPSGFYTILTKEINHINHDEHLNMPYSMEFYGNYFIHGWPSYLDGTPVASTYSGGCIRLSTDDAANVFAFADRGTGMFVYDQGTAASVSSIPLSGVPIPMVSAASYLVADVDTGDVYAERNAKTQRPIASVTKLMTALVANETIMFDHKITVPRGKLTDIEIATDTAPETFVIGDLLYPLLMESNNNIADVLARYFGASAFVDWMNRQAKALDMTSTTFADATGASSNNVSTPEDLYRLAVYLVNKKSFVWKITRTPSKIIVAGDGSQYPINNFNRFSNLPSFVGGKVGHTASAQDTMVSVFSIPMQGKERRIAVIVLDSADYTTDTKKLADWFGQSAQDVNTGCASCAQPPAYPKIQI